MIGKMLPQNKNVHERDNTRAYDKDFTDDEVILDQNYIPVQTAKGTAQNYYLQSFVRQIKNKVI